MLFADLVAVHRQRGDCLADEKTWAFIKADDWVARVIGLRIQPQEALHLGDELRIDLPDTPSLLEMGLQFVFFRMLPTWVCEMLLQ